MQPLRFLFAGCLLLSTLPALAQTPNLQSESQQEFRRVFGSSEGASQFTAPTAANANLKAESAAEFRRVFGESVVSGAVELQRMSTPDTIDSTLLNALALGTDNRRYFYLWHLIALDLTALDHRALLSQSPTTFHEQFGPARAARALALIHQAMFEAANAFDQKYTSTLPDPMTFETASASQDAAIVEAAYEIMHWLYPGLKEIPTGDVQGTDVCMNSSHFSLQAYYECSKESLGDTPAIAAGIDVGRVIAEKIISKSSLDGSQLAEPIWGRDFVPRVRPDTPNYAFVQWQVDPVSSLMTALGGYWGNVQPFALTSRFQFRPDERDSPAAAIRSALGMNLPITEALKRLPSYAAVRKWGEETRMDRTGRPVLPPPSGDGFFVAQFWAYDGTINLCAPARLYNQIAAHVLKHIEDVPDDGYANLDVHSVTDIARFYALINMAMGDAAIAAWDAKYYFQFPRPVTYIRAADELNPLKDGTKWFPVGAQVTNSDQPFNITPPFPAYPSGHATFGGALFGVLRQYMKPRVELDFLSDEFNKRNKDVYNYVRCSEADTLTPKKFCQPRPITLDCAERENADSRLFMGVHWVDDADDGIVMGNKVARQAYRTLMKPKDASGVVSDPPAQMFSVDPASVAGRASLVCPGIDLPLGWDHTDPEIGFGPLTIVPVTASP